MDIYCRCGQPFTIGDASFPHRVGCHACGRHFLVLDTGEFIDVDPEAQPVDLTAVQVAHAIAAGRMPSAEICTEEIKDTFAPPSWQDAHTRLRTDLRLIDMLWDIERTGHSLIPAFGIILIPRKSMSAVLGLAFLVCWSVLVALA